MKKERIFALLLAACLTVPVAACTVTPPAQTEAPTVEVTEPATEPVTEPHIPEAVGFFAGVSKLNGKAVTYAGDKTLAVSGTTWEVGKNLTLTGYLNTEEKITALKVSTDGGATWKELAATLTADTLTAEDPGIADDLVGAATTRYDFAVATADYTIGTYRFLFRAETEKNNYLDFLNMTGASIYTPLADKTGDATSDQYDWPSVTPEPSDTSKENNKTGSLKYTVSDDEQTVTISYTFGGKEYTYTVPNNYNYTNGPYGCTDDLGRNLFEQGDAGITIYEDGKRYAGLFYFLWLGEHGDSGIFDMTHIFEENGDAALKVSCNKWGDVGTMHFFAEPLYGYYYSSDEWVMRKHVELLTAANIDFLYFDVTNGYYYQKNALKLMSILQEYRDQGYDTPQVVFYTHSGAANVVRDLYNNIYSKNLYPDTWFCIDGKPVIVAPDETNINDFFTIRREQWPNEASKECAWPWMDFDAITRTFNDLDGNPDAISVSVAQHCYTVSFSAAAYYGAGNAKYYGKYSKKKTVFTNLHDRGRSFDGGELLNITADSYKYGYNMQYQFNRAFTSEAKYVLVTSWNEWVAQRQPTSDDTVWFVDTASLEYSRDIEMTRGYYFDNYYVQLAYNIQQLKGTAPSVVQDMKKAINLTAGFDQWTSVLLTYRDPMNDAGNRNATGFGHQTLTETSGRNDIVAAKVTHDTKNLYFYIQCSSSITKFDPASSWMQIFVDIDRDGSNGWYGYDYLINATALTDRTTTVACFNGADNHTYSLGKIGEVTYTVDGRNMMIAVPLEMLGITDDEVINLEFKIADSLTVINEMEDFYIEGDVMPLGRLNNVYQTYLPAKAITEDAQ